MLTSLFAVDTKYYFTNAQRKILGPCTLREILRLAQQGEVDAQTAIVRPADSPHWMSFLAALQRDVSAQAAPAAHQAPAVTPGQYAEKSITFRVSPQTPSAARVTQSSQSSQAIQAGSTVQAGRGAGLNPAAAPGGVPAPGTTIGNTASKPPRSQVNFRAPQLPGNEAVNSLSSGAGPAITTPAPAAGTEPWLPHCL